MLDATGRRLAIGDKVEFTDGMNGTVVCCIDDNQGTPGNPIEQWLYLGSGVMIETVEAGLVHLTESAHLRISN